MLWSLAGRETARMLDRYGTFTTKGKAVGFEDEDLANSSFIVLEKTVPDASNSVSA